MKQIKLLLQSVIEIIFFFLPQKNPSQHQLEHTKIVAHRGWHNNINIIENTLSSIDLALKNGVDAVEIDLRWTKDLVPIVFHDEDFFRVFGSMKQVSELNFSEIRVMFPQIPTISEVVEKYASKIVLFIELKDQYFINFFKQKEILKQVLSPLKAGENFFVISFHEKSFTIIEDDLKQYSFLIADLNENEILTKAKELGLAGILGHYLLMGQTIIQSLKKDNMLVGTGYPRTLNTFKREVGRDIDWIFTNYPWKLLSYKAKLKD